MVNRKRKGGAVLRSGKRTGSDVPNPNYITPVGTPAGSPVVPVQPQGHHHIQPFNPFPFGFQPQELFPPFPTFAPIPPNSEGETDNESEGSYGGSRTQMEDNFFFPPRDRDRRYAINNYSKVVPHHGGFRMTHAF